MNEKKKALLEAHGWKVGTAEELLRLTPEEAADVEIRLKLSDVVSRVSEEEKLDPDSAR